MRARNIEKGLGYLIARLRIELASSLDQQLAADSQLGPLGLSAAQYAIIATLAAEDSKMCSTVLCERMSYDAGAMTRMLDRLEAKQLLRRQRCTQDRRRIYLELTEEARVGLPAHARDFPRCGQPAFTWFQCHRNTRARGLSVPHAAECTTAGRTAGAVCCEESRRCEVDRVTLHCRSHVATC